jgi:PAS domain S-box-containing protein
MKQDGTPKRPKASEEVSIPCDTGMGASAPNVQTILDALPYYVILVDSAHTVLMANKAVKESLGLPPEALLGSYCPKLIHNRDDAYPGCPLEIACAKGCSAECELLDEERGRIMFSGVYETPLYTSAGRRVYLHTARDITDQRQAEEARLSMERIALTRERMARVGEIASGVAHLVRNPLQGVMNALDILDETAGDKRESSWNEPIAMMREGLARISKVTERLLTLTRDVPFRPRETDVFGCLDEVRSMLGHASAENMVSVALEAPADCPARLDPDRFIEAVTNVVGNAIDASPSGGSVTIRARLLPRPDAGLEVVVVDSGVGMTNEVQARIFDPFFSTKPIGKGSGLGLAITKRILEEHGGSIAVASEPGRGTMVTLLFPQTSKAANQ